jgi:hypothetical protein
MIRKRILTAATLATAAAGVVLGVASGAQAASSAYGWVAGNGQLCVTTPATYQVRGEGNANYPGITFRLRKTGGSTIYVSPVPVTAFAAEGRTSNGTFLGSGQYQLCANNNTASSVYVSRLVIMSDGEFS